MGKKFPLPRGTSDVLPRQAGLWQKAERSARDILQQYGYREIRTPIFEKTALFARSLGETSDVVQKQMLNLARQDSQGDDSGDGGGFSLRPEGTAAVVRSYIENNLDKQENLSKFYYIGPMFRGERPQKGRLRQFHQIGVEAIGPQSAVPFLDAEVIALSVRILQKLGVTDFELKLNTLGSMDDKEAFAKVLRESLKPRVTDLCPDCQQRFERNVFRILDCKNRTCQSIVDKTDVGLNHLSEESHDYFKKVKEGLKALGIAYVETSKLVRGLDYYNHTVFEISAPNLGSQDALGAGGRYNNLVQQLGGPEVDAIGFALGIERILLALPEDQQNVSGEADVFVIALNEAAFKAAFEVLDGLRKKGVCADMGYRSASMKSQMRSANKTGAPYVIIIGEDEIKRGVVTLKNMNEGTQVQKNIDQIDQLVAEIKER